MIAEGSSQIALQIPDVDVNAELAHLTDDGLVSIYHQAQAVGKFAWRVRCAVCAEIVRRAKEREERGEVSRIVEAAARDISVTAQTIWSNAKIHNEFLDSDDPDVQRACDVLEEVSWYYEALRVPDHKAAIVVMADKKIENPTRYTCGVARKEVREGTILQNKENNPAEGLSAPLVPFRRTLANLIRDIEALDVPNLDDLEFRERVMELVKEYR